MSANVISSWCNSCGRETDHNVLFSEVSSTREAGDDVTENRTVLVRCGGCKEPTIRNEVWYFSYIPDETNTGGDLVEVVFSPPRLWRRPASWLGDLEKVDPELGEILAEIYLAANDFQLRLLASGVRTALDYLMTQIVGDVGDFPTKLEAMVKAGHLTNRQSETFKTVIEAASAAAHRGFKPPRELLDEMINAMETLVRDHYLTGPALQNMRRMIPPRPPRPKK